MFWGPQFQMYTFLHLWHLFPPFFKMAVVNTNVNITQTLRHLEQFC